MDSQRKNPRKVEPWEHGIVFVAMVVITIIVVIATASSCSPKIIDHYIYQRDTTYISKERVDSVYQHDSVFVKEKGDTLYIYKEKIRDRYRYVHDTLYREKVDSVVIEQEKIVEVEKPLSGWKQFKLGAFWWLISAVFVALVWIFRKTLWKLIKSIIL